MLRLSKAIVALLYLELAPHLIKRATKLPTLPTTHGFYGHVRISVIKTVQWRRATSNENSRPKRLSVTILGIDDAFQNLRDKIRNTCC